jgi:hypothetical protein
VDRLVVSGTVDLGNNTLTANLGFTPAAGDAFAIIANDGSDAVRAHSWTLRAYDTSASRAARLAIASSSSW